MLEGDRLKALEIFREDVRREPNIAICARALLLAVEVEDQEIQDELCQKMKGYSEPKEDGADDLTRRSARVIAATLRTKDPEDPDLETMASLMTEYGKSPRSGYARATRTNFGYIFGRILELDGQPEKAKVYFRQVVDIGLFGANSCTLAAHALARLSEDEDL